MRSIIIILLLMLLAGPALSQSAPEQSSPVILPFHTYHAKWLRYTNARDGEPILAVKGVTEFPYRFVVSRRRLEVEDFADAATLESLLEAAAYDEAAIAGTCKTDKLPEHLPDVFCTPGTSAMPWGQVVLALYEPETNEIVALTASIDNKAGGATNADWSSRPAPASQPTAIGCGDYVAGQWIKAGDFVNSANLPVRGATGATTDYQCMVDIYFQAYSIAGSGGGAGGSQPSGGGNNGNGGSNAPTEPIPLE